MDKNGARGRAEKTVSSFLEGCLQAGMVESILKKHYNDEQTISAIRQEIQAIASEHAERADFHRDVEQGMEVKQKGTNPVGDKVSLYIGCEAEETEGQYSVLLYSLGYSIDFGMSTPEDALNLYNALLKVKEVEAD